MPKAESDEVAWVMVMPDIHGGMEYRVLLRIVRWHVGQFAVLESQPKPLTLHQSYQARQHLFAIDHVLEIMRTFVFPTVFVGIPPTQ